MPRIECSVCAAYLLEPTPGMQSFSQRSWNGHFPGIFAVSSGSCTVRILQPLTWLTHKLSRNLATVISAARDLNEHGGKHRLLQTSSQPMSE